MKKILRAEGIKARCSLTEKERTLKSQRIWDTAFKLKEVKEAHTISCYIGVNSEVKTLGLISKLLGAGKNVAIPVVVDKVSMEMCFIQSLDELERGTHFIEPRKECRKVCSPGKIDVLFVPGIAFSEAGYRVGYGQGYYDYYLDQVKKSIPRIGLAFECQIFENVPVEQHDQKLHRIATEKRVIKCGLLSRLEKIAREAEPD